MMMLEKAAGFEDGVCLMAGKGSRMNLAASFRLMLLVMIPPPSLCLLFLLPNSFLKLVYLFLTLKIVSFAPKD